MNTLRGEMHEEKDDLQASTPTASVPTRPLYWSVRRELWENRALYIVPPIVMAVGLLAILFHEVIPPHEMPVWAESTPGQRAMSAMLPFNAVTGMLMAAAFVIGVVYCLDALHGERRDRSILFWKSMPVSDTATVMSKALIPIVVLPAIVFVLGMAAQVILMLADGIILLNDDRGLADLWQEFSIFQRPARLLYFLAASALWHAPVYAWLLMVSGWARRAVFVWAVLPLFTLFIIETLAFGTERVAGFLPHRVFGWMHLAGLPDPASNTGAIGQLTPGRFLSAPDLWLGLLVAAVFIAAAIRLRRYRDPI